MTANRTKGTGNEQPQCSNRDDEMRDDLFLVAVLEAAQKQWRRRHRYMNRHSEYGRSGNTPRMIVIHAMGEYILMDDNKTFEHAPDFLERMKYSAHALVSPDGEVIRCRNDNETAFHAKGFNTNSLGMEILVAGKHTYRSFVRTIELDYVQAAQYAAAVSQCKEWVKLHKIERIVRHSDLSPGRKVDPGSGFSFDKFLADVRKT